MLLCAGYSKEVSNYNTKPTFCKYIQSHVVDACWLGFVDLEVQYKTIPNPKKSHFCLCCGVEELQAHGRKALSSSLKPFEYMPPLCHSEFHYK